MSTAPIRPGKRALIKPLIAEKTEMVKNTKSCGIISQWVKSSLCEDRVEDRVEEGHNGTGEGSGEGE